MLFRKFLVSILILALLLNGAMAPIAYAADPTDPEAAAAVKKIDERAAELDRAIDEEAGGLPKTPEAAVSVQALHDQNHKAQAEAKELAKQKGVVGYFKALDAAGWVRHVLGGFKAISRSSTAASAAQWGGLLASASGLGLVTAAAGIELGATIFEMKIGSTLNNFPYNVEKSKLGALPKEIIATIQGSIMSTLVFWVANPAVTQTLAALNDPAHHPFPTLYGAAMGFLAGIAQSAAYTFGFRGAGNIEAKGWLNAQVKSILFALTGMVGFYAAMRIASGDPAQQASVFKMLYPIWGLYIATGIGAFFVPKRNCKEATTKI